MGPTNFSNFTIDSGVIVSWLITGLLLAFGHWFPWPRPLRNIECYVYGVLSIVVPHTCLYLALRSDYSEVVALWGNIVVGGVVVVLAYGYDTLRNSTTRASVAEKALDHERRAE